MPANDAVSEAVRVIRSMAPSNRRAQHWENVDRDLRAFVAELMLSRPALNSSAPFNMLGAAKISEAKEALVEVNRCLKQASKLPRLVRKFGARVFGRPGLITCPEGAFEDLERALGLIAEHMARQEQGFSRAIAGKRRTAGSRATVLERATGTAIVRFLQRLVLLWMKATGQARLGKPFETIARDLIAVALGHAPDDLRRQIKVARNRGDEVPTEWTLVTDIQNLPLDTRGRKPRRTS